MIGGHPELYGFPELGLFRRHTVGPLLFDPPGWKGQPAKFRLSGLLRALAQQHAGEQTEHTVADAYRWLRSRRAWGVAHVLDHLLDSVDPLVGVEKTPDNSGREDNLARIVGNYPRARFIHLTRHPLTSQRSMYEAWNQKPYWDVPPELFRVFCMGSWYFHHRRIAEFTARIGPDRALRVRSEDVLNDGGVQLRRICRWLGVDDSDDAIAAMRRPEASPYVGAGPPGAMGGNDPKFLLGPVPHEAPLPRSLDVPSDWIVDPWMLSASIELAYELGYTHADR